MQDARCALNVSVLLSTALVKPEGNATEGDLDGIYPHGRVPFARCFFPRLKAWHSAKVLPGRTLFDVGLKRVANAA